LAKRSLNVYYLSGIAILAAVSVGAYWLNWVFGIYPDAYFRLFVIYLIPLSVLWLTLGPLYALRRYIVISGIFLASLVVVQSILLSQRGTERAGAIVIAQLSGIAFGLSLAILAVVVYMYLIAKVLRTTFPVVRHPKVSVLFLESGYYFLAGTLYFIFISIDRVVVWSMSGPLILWFNTVYEIGAGMALLSMIPILGILNVYIVRLSEKIRQLGSALLVKQIDLFNGSILRFYQRAVSLIALGAVPSFATLYAISNLFVRDPRSMFVFMVESVGNVFLAIFLLNALFCYYFWRPEPVFVSLALASVVNVSIGFILTRALGFEYAAVAYTIGAALVAFLTSLNLIRRLKFAAEYYYAAF